nr:MAG TPA: hypothetical protein [Caudoviricetes sp.]
MLFPFCLYPFFKNLSIDFYLFVYFLVYLQIYFLVTRCKYITLF